MSEPSEVVGHQLLMHRDLTVANLEHVDEPVGLRCGFADGGEVDPVEELAHLVTSLVRVNVNLPGDGPPRETTTASYPHDGGHSARTLCRGCSTSQSA